MSLAIIGVLAGVLALTLMWKRPKTRRTQSVLMFVVGLVVGGLVGHVRDRLDALASSGGASATAKLFGVGVPYAIAFFVCVWWFLDMDFDGLINGLRRRAAGKSGATSMAGVGAKLNRHKCTVATAWLGLLVPIALAALPVVGDLPDAARHGLSTIAASVGK